MLTGVVPIDGDRQTKSAGKTGGSAVWLLCLFITCDQVLGSDIFTNPTTGSASVYLNSLKAIERNKTESTNIDISKEDLSIFANGPKADQPQPFIQIVRQMPQTTVRSEAREKQIRELQRNIDSMLLRWTEAHPDVIQARRELNRLLDIQKKQSQSNITAKKKIPKNNESLHIERDPICLAVVERDPSITGVEHENIVYKRYSRIEFNINIDNLCFENPYDPNQVDLSAKFISPSGKKWSIWGFFDGNDWKVRFAANEVGKWTYQIFVSNLGRHANSEKNHFVVGDSEDRGWLRVSEIDRRYFNFADGSSFFGVGQTGIFDGRADVEKTVKGIEDMGANGLNTLLLWWGNHYPLESEGIDTANSGFGFYDQSQARRIDRIVDAAERANVTLIPAIWVHSQFRDKYQFRWSAKHDGRSNPYRHFVSVNNWSTDPASLEYQRRLLRYIIARWSYSTAIGVWELFTELDLAPINFKYKWLEETAGWLRKHDPFQHPISASLSGGKKWKRLYELIDVPQYHEYQGLARRLVQTVEEMRKHGKPIMIGEFGIDDPSRRLEQVIDANYAVAFSGAAMVPLYWWLGNDRYSRPAGEYTWGQHLKLNSTLARFVKAIPFGRTPLRPINFDRDASFYIRDSEHSRVSRNGGAFGTNIKPKGEWDSPVRANTTFVLRGDDGDDRDHVKLNPYLHGRTHAEKRGVITLILNAREGAELDITIEDYSRLGARLTVKADGVTIIDADLHGTPSSSEPSLRVKRGRSFSVLLPRGSRLIQIQNVGKDWVKLEKIRLSGLVPLTTTEEFRLRLRSGDIRLHGIRSQHGAYMYFPKNVAWRNIGIRLHALSQGAYNVNCIDVNSGAPISGIPRPTTDEVGDLDFSLGPADRGTACRVELAE